MIVTDWGKQEKDHWEAENTPPGLKLSLHLSPTQRPVSFFLFL
jgi:hypothetical protein